MGLAPYGNPDSDRTRRWRDLILENLVDVREDGSLLLNMDYFDYATGLKMCCDDKWTSLFGLPPRPRESHLDQRYMDMALAIQQVTEEIVFRLADTTKRLTGAENLVMAGGVALNCVANGKLLRRGTFKNIWIQPPPATPAGPWAPPWPPGTSSAAGEETPQPGHGSDAGRLSGAGFRRRRDGAAGPAASGAA